MLVTNVFSAQSFRMVCGTSEVWIWTTKKEKERERERERDHGLPISLLSCHTHLCEDGLQYEGCDGLPMCLGLCQLLIVLHQSTVPLQVVSGAVLEEEGRRKRREERRKDEEREEGR